MEFRNFRDAVAAQFSIMLASGSELYFTSVEKDDIYATYLNSFPEGTNPQFREATEHDCSACKGFIRAAGNVVTIQNGRLVSIWDVNPSSMDPAYAAVAEALSAFVKAAPVEGIWRYESKIVGITKNSETTADGSVRTWNHFSLDVPRAAIMSPEKYGPFKSDFTANFGVLHRSLTHFTDEAIATVEELIEAKSLYRGEEHKSTLTALRKAKTELAQKVAAGYPEDLAIWEMSVALKERGRFRGTVICSLVEDLADGRDLEEAVASYEKKVAPENYKRSSALITQRMIDDAEAKVVELGLENALHRRFAVGTDLTINNVLFADRSLKMKSGAFGGLLSPTSEDKVTVEKATDISIEDFVKNVMNRSSTIEVMVENRHNNQMMSVIAPVDETAGNILAWNNNFSWSYNGDFTDSIKERVKKAGGNVEGDVRCSLSWSNFDDLDLHVMTPGGEICFHNRWAAGGELDVDENAGRGKTRTPVENIFWRNLSSMPDGNYEVLVNQYNRRESDNIGFELEFDVMGRSVIYSHTDVIRTGETVSVLKFFKKNGEITVSSGLHGREMSKGIWGVQTNRWTRVMTMMLSPNYWDDQAVGNKHWFFILEDCKNPDSARGFYNEFIRPELLPHRKVLEVLAGKMKAPVADEQLSGIGFSSTVRNNLLVRATSDAGIRTYNVMF